MAGRPQPGLHSVSPHVSDHSSDPFTDRPRGFQFQEPQPNPSGSTLSVPQEYGGQGGSYGDEDVENHHPAGGNVAGSVYPPGPGPDVYGDPYACRYSAASSVSNGAESAWHLRQTIQRDVKKTAKLTEGNFITEYHVPARVYSAVEDKWKNGVGTTEFSHMRYSAATCDPDEFSMENGWSLRTKMYNRKTELLIAVTSYNEDKTLYSRTLHGVMQNIRDICRTEQSKYFRPSAEEGVTGWQMITVALIVDGLEPMDKTVLDLLATIGVYQDGVMKQEVDGKDTVAHIFEYTTQISVDATPKLILPLGDDPNNLVPVQIIFVLKVENQKKINSHRWLFNAIGRMLQPEVCVLIDAGTKPGHKSIYYLWEAFYNNANLGGCCGEIYAMTNKGRKLLNPLVAAQNFEYKMSNILDKPLESSFGYVSVLPGAFSAYRYRAIQGRPLEQYFHGDHSLADRLGAKGIHGMNIFTKNMFLAEDRILCFELVAKAGCKWTSTYVRLSKAETDVPESVPELIGQRRRWLNGSFAASIYAIRHCGRLYSTDHGNIRMFCFHIQLLYNLISLVLSWFALANLWLAFSITINLLPTTGLVLFGGNNHTGLLVTHRLNLTLKWIYVGFLATQFVLALGNRPKSERIAHVITLWVYALLAIYLVVCSIALTVKAFATTPPATSSETPVGALVVTITSTFGIYFFASFLYRDPWHMFSSFLQYLCLAPSFTNVLNVHAFCNSHDLSWGTKGSDKAGKLQSVSSSKVKNEAAVVQDTELVQENLDVVYEKTKGRALTEVEAKEVPQKPSIDDQSKGFRTRLVVLWILTNGVLVGVVQNMDGLAGDCPTTEQSLRKKQSIYFAFIMYIGLALSGVRFAGCLWFFFKPKRFRSSRRP